jgi:hypothetical protein
MNTEIAPRCVEQTGNEARPYHGRGDVRSVADQRNSALAHLLGEILGEGGAKHHILFDRDAQDFACCPPGTKNVCLKICADERCLLSHT